MFVATRPASRRIQLVALLLAVPGGVITFFFFVQILLLFLPDDFGPWLLWICIAACAYFLAAPATWRGLWRRSLAIVGFSLLVFAVLGYLLAFAGLPAGGMPDLSLAEQLLVLAFGLGSVGWSRTLRDRPPAPVSSAQAHERSDPGSSAPEPTGS